MSNIRAIAFKSGNLDELADSIEDWTDVEPDDMEITHCNYQVTKMGAWDAPDNEELVFSALIFYKYPLNKQNEH